MSRLKDNANNWYKCQDYDLFKTLFWLQARGPPPGHGLLNSYKGNHVYI